MGGEGSAAGVAVVVEVVVEMAGGGGDWDERRCEVAREGHVGDVAERWGGAELAQEGHAAARRLSPRGFALYHEVLALSWNPPGG